MHKYFDAQTHIQGTFTNGIEKAAYLMKSDKPMEVLLHIEVGASQSSRWNT